MTLPAAAQRFGVSTVTVRRWMEAGRLEGVRRSERWIREESVQRLMDELLEDAATWVSLADAADIIGCSIATVPGFVTEGLVVQRPGPRQQASINRGSAERAGRVLAERREAKRAERRLRDEQRTSNGPPDDGTVWLSVKTTALLLGLSESGVTLKVRAGTLPATQRGRRWWVRRDDAERAAAAKAFAAAQRDHRDAPPL
ncbi:helix-turn-helix domain-containing protein [Nocardioides sp. SOB77]|uniref:Helix-turn-helix domain-containing protein n=1 Tax=Nocardioides oceani TaxID=3058369 RepID=A0ABT8FLT1_9ACTN|nr:helix-turn-helix domain-containing protein [Nocardioides oceani]MDN4175636.1 helix-turn-helix domain-containing protein [Nocardioides oceani]